MKKFIAILLCFSILYSSMEKLALIVRYQVNIKYYSTVLCGKKGTTDIDCKGKCFLRKELKALDNQNKSPLKPTREKQEIAPYLAVISSFNINPFKEVQKRDEVCTNYLLLMAQEVNFSIFHPPCFL